MKRLNLPLYADLGVAGILNTPLLNDASIRAWGAIPANVISHYNSYLALFPNAPSPGPIEKHPYIEPHIVDFDLNRNFLLLGTFPPNSHFNIYPGVIGLPNPNIQPNIALNYFYGNEADLWDYLFGVAGPALNIANVKALLNNRNIAITDVFDFVQRGIMNNPSDSNLFNIVLNCRINNVFNEDSKVKTILFTSGSLSAFRRNNVSTLTGFRWILEDCVGGYGNCKISGDISGVGPYFPINILGVTNAVAQQNGGIVWWIKFNERNYKVVNLPSPSPQAAIQMEKSHHFKKWVNFMANNNGLPLPTPIQAVNLKQFYLPLHQNVFVAPFTKQYRRVVYEMVLNDTIHLI